MVTFSMTFMFKVTAFLKSNTYISKTVRLTDKVTIAH